MRQKSETQRRRPRTSGRPLDAAIRPRTRSASCWKPFAADASQGLDPLCEETVRVLLAGKIDFEDRI